jgi:hypothetical protein
MDYNLTVSQKVELAKLMSDMSGKLELIVEFNDKEIGSLSETANFGNMTNVITELTEKMSSHLKNYVIRKEYADDKFPFAVKIKYLGEYMMMTRVDIKGYQMQGAFELLSMAIQRGIDNAKNGVLESNMVKVTDDKIFTFYK